MSPSNLTGIAQDSATILLSWDPPNGHHNGIIQEYRLNITEVETGRMFQSVSAITSLLMSSLHPDYTYEWTVTAFTVGEGPYSYTHRVTTFEDGKKKLAIVHECSYHTGFLQILPTQIPQ